MRGALETRGNSEGWRGWRRKMMVIGSGKRNERRGKRGQGSRKKLRRKCEVSSVDCLSRREVGIRSKSGTETEKDPGKVVKPVSSGLLP